MKTALFLLAVVGLSYRAFGQTTEDPRCYSFNDYVKSVSCRAGAITVDLNTDSYLFCPKTLGVVWAVFSLTGSHCDDATLKAFTGFTPPNNPQFTMSNTNEAGCKIDYTTVYGSGGQPDAYATSQYFYAAKLDVPTLKPVAGAERYNFSVFCSYPARAHINTNHSVHGGGSGGHGGHGQVPEPTNHVRMNLTDAQGNALSPDDGNVVKLGDHIHALIAIPFGDDVYDSVLPDYCEFSDGKEFGTYIPFINDQCPINDTIENWDTIVDVGKTNKTSYYIDFLAYSMQGKQAGILELDCYMFLCINFWDCYRGCWMNTTEYSGPSRSKRSTKSKLYTQKTFTLTIVGEMSTKSPDGPNKESIGGLPDWALYTLVAMGALLVFLLLLCVLCCLCCGLTLFGFGMSNKGSRREEVIYENEAYENPREYKLSIPHAWISSQESAPF